MTGSAKDYFREVKQVLDKVDLRTVEKAVQVMWAGYKMAKTIFFIGNGGSASTATHLAADIGKNTVVDHRDDKERRFRTMALTDNPAWIMGLGNDLGFEDIFVEQLKNWGQRGDVVVAISGSGNSPNVVKAVEWAKK